MFRYCLPILIFILSACGSGPSPTSANPNFLGLLRVTITGIGDGATQEATAEWVKGGVSNQSATVISVNGTSALDDVQLIRKAVNFSDDDGLGIRYVYTTFSLINRTTTGFQNLTLYAVNIPSNIGGTAIASMTAATGTAITSESVAREFQPAHAMHGFPGGFEVNPKLADLQFFTPTEVDNPSNGIKQQAVAQGIIPSNSTVLQYGFVARNTSGTRVIGHRNTALDCTDNSCKGYVTLAYKFPRISPRQNNPFSFTLYFVVANEANSYISQSLEDRTTNTAAGLSSTPNFVQTRVLSDSSFRMVQDNLSNLCQVKTAVGTPTNTSDILMPSTLPIPTPGSLDSCFGAGGKRTTAIGSSDDLAYAIALQPDGKMVVAGESYNVSNATTDFVLTRYNPDGSLDTTFDGNGKVATDFGSSNDILFALAIQSNGKIVVAGSSWNGSNLDFALARYNPNGSLDTSFDTDGKVTTPIGPSNDQVTELAIQGDGKIVAAGASSNGSDDDFTVVRYNTNGSLDTSFDTDGKITTAIGPNDDFITGLSLQRDGKMVVAGSTWNGSNYDFAVARYNTNGSLDTFFDSDGKVTTPIGPSHDRVTDLSLQSDEKIVVAGYSNNSGNYDFAVVRYNTNGSLDTSFDGDGKVTTSIGSSDDFAYDIALQSDGKMVLAGYSDNGTDTDFALARYNPNGSLDPTFDTDGKVITAIGVGSDKATALAIQNNGKIVVAGYSNSSNADFALARYNP